MRVYVELEISSVRVLEMKIAMWEPKYYLWCNICDDNMMISACDLPSNVPLVVHGSQIVVVC